MNTFFNNRLSLGRLSPDAKKRICESLSLKDLLSLATTGDRSIRPLALEVLFQNTSSLAVRSQQLFLNLWQTNASEFMPKDRVIIKAISSLNVANKLPGLLTVINRNKPDSPIMPLQTEYVDSILMRAHHNDSLVQLIKLVPYLSPSQLDMCLIMIAARVEDASYIPPSEFSPAEFYKLIRNIINVLTPEQSIVLFDTTVQGLKSQSSIVAEKALNILKIIAPKLSSIQLTTASEAAKEWYHPKKYKHLIRHFDPLIQYMPEHYLQKILDVDPILMRAYHKDSVVQLIKLVPYLSPSQLDMCLTMIAAGVEDASYIPPSEFYTLITNIIKDLAPEQGIKLFDITVQRLKSQSSTVAEKALNILKIIAPKLESIQLTTAFEAAKELYQPQKCNHFIRHFAPLIQYMPEHYLQQILDELHSYLEKDTQDGLSLFSLALPYLKTETVESFIDTLFTLFDREEEQKKFFLAQKLASMHHKINNDRVDKLIEYYMEMAKEDFNFNGLIVLADRMTPQQALDTVELIMGDLESILVYKSPGAINCLKLMLQHLKAPEIIILHQHIINLLVSHTDDPNMLFDNLNELLKHLIISFPTLCSIDGLNEKQYNQFIDYIELFMPLLPAEQCSLVLEKAKKNVTSKQTHTFLQNNIRLINSTQVEELIDIMAEQLSNSSNNIRTMNWNTLKALISGHTLKQIPALLPEALKQYKPQNLLEFLDFINIITKIAAQMPKNDLNILINSLVTQLSDSTYVEPTISLFRLISYLSEEHRTQLLPTLLSALECQEVHLRTEAHNILKHILPNLSLKQRQLVYLSIMPDLTQPEHISSYKLQALSLLIPHTMCDEKEVLAVTKIFALTADKDVVYYKEKHKKRNLLACLDALASTPLVLAEAINYLTQVTNDGSLSVLIRQRSLAVLSTWTTNLLLEPKINKEQLKVTLDVIDYPEELIPLARLSQEDTDEFIELQLVSNLCRSYCDSVLELNNTTARAPS